MITENVVKPTETVEIEDPLIPVLQQELGENYHDFRLFQEKGPRRCYLAKWGPGDEERIIKVDNTDLESPRAKRHLQRGCDTANDIEALSKIPDAEKHNISRLSDYRKRNGFVISAEHFYDGHRSLKDIVAEDGPLDPTSARTVFGNLIDAVSHYSGKGFLHRDISPQNVLVRLEDNGTKKKAKHSVLTDFANAREKGNIKPSFLPTAGAHLITDPFIFGQFTGQEGEYDDNAEIYEICSTMAYSVLGKPIFDFDPDKRTARVVSTRENLLDENGRINKEKYEAALKQAVKTMPWGFRWKFGKLLERGLSSDREQRFGSLEKFVSNFKNNNWGIMDEIRKSKLVLTVGGLVLAVAACGVHVLYDNMSSDKRVLEKQIQEAEKYAIASDFDGGNLGFTNNLLSLDYVVYRGYSDLLYGKDYRGTSKFPRDLVLQKGEKLRIVPELKSKPLPSHIRNNSFPAFHGAVYIEGWPAKHFTDFMDSPDSARNYDEPVGLPTEVNFEIPKDIPDGNYGLVMEIYAHDEDTEISWGNNALKFSRYETPERVIAKKRIPITIGKPAGQFNLEEIAFDCINARLDVQPPDKMAEIAKEGITYEFYIPEMGFRHSIVNNSNTFNCFSTNLRFLPKPKDETEKTLVVVARDSEGKLIMFGGVPIAGQRLYEDSMYWDACPNGRGFADKLVQYRRHICGEIPEMPKYESKGIPNRNLNVIKEEIEEASKRERLGSYADYTHMGVRGLGNIQTPKDSRDTAFNSPP